LLDLAQLLYVKCNENVILLGLRGVEKTPPAIAFGIETVYSLSLRIGTGGTMPKVMKKSKAILEQRAMESPEGEDEGLIRG
jgi:hypothetical protein